MSQILNWLKIDGVLGIRTRGGRMVGADESTKLRRQPIYLIFKLVFIQVVIENTYLRFKAGFLSPKL